MTDEELIARLRDGKLTWGDRWNAADRIEQLVKEKDNNHKVGLGWAEIAHQESNKYLQALRRIELLATTCEQLVATCEALVKERDEAKRLMQARHREMLAADGLMRKHQRRAERMEAAADYILDGMGIDAPNYEIDADDDFLDAANSKWVRDTLTRLAEAMRGNDDTR